MLMTVFLLGSMHAGLLAVCASEISAFVTPDSFMQYTVMGFGMRNPPATFQHLMQIGLSGVAKCEANIDDVVVYSADRQSHMDTLSVVFQCLQDASLTLNIARPPSLMLARWLVRI